MPLADQMRFKIQKLDRAIEALGDLPSWQVSPVLGLLKADRAELRRSIASSRVADMVECDCGHECGAAMVMSASMGTSCPDCYDTLSD